MSRNGWRTWARGVRPVGISTTSCETSPTTICALAAASASLRAGATGHRPRGRHEDASRLPGCRRRARQAVVLEGIGAAFEQAGRVLAQRRVGIRPRPAEAQRVRQASGPREHARPLRTPPSGELIRRRIRREADRSRRAVRQQQRPDAPTRTIVCTLASVLRAFGGYRVAVEQRTLHTCRDGAAGHRGAPRPYVVHIGLTPHRWGGFSRENWEFETHRIHNTSHSPIARGEDRTPRLVP